MNSHDTASGQACAQGNTTPFVGIDWGTTHRRAYVLDAQGALAQSHADAEGALACKGRFAQSLDAALQTLGVLSPTTVMSGMVGSALGWVEVPYLDATVSLHELPKRLHTVPHSGQGGATLIVPGYCIRNAQGQPDVMRGEETQLLGALTLGHHSGWFVLPGTHSKWVQLAQGRIVQLRTYMTGELFETLRTQGTIAAACASDGGAWDAAAFADGVRASRHGALSNLLFGCRARVVCGDMPASSVRSYLSGLLIGHEMHDVMGQPDASDATRSFQLIGSPELAKIYQGCAQQLGLSCEVIDAQRAFLGAMACIQNYRTTI